MQLKYPDTALIGILVLALESPASSFIFFGYGSSRTCISFGRFRH